MNVQVGAAQKHKSRLRQGEVTWRTLPQCSTSSFWLSVTFCSMGKGKKYVIPIQMSLILVILLSCTYSLPLRLKKESLATRNEVPSFELAADILGDIINESLV